MAETRPCYETADGRFDEDRLREYVTRYDGPEDPDYPGCVPIPMTVEQFDNYEGGVEYWSRERGTALICRDGGPAHEIPGGMLPGLLTRIEMGTRLADPLLRCPEDGRRGSGRGNGRGDAPGSVDLPAPWRVAAERSLDGGRSRSASGRRSRSRQHD